MDKKEEKYGKIVSEVINIFVKNDMSVGEYSNFMLFLRHKIEEQKILPQEITETTLNIGVENCNMSRDCLKKQIANDFVESLEKSQITQKELREIYMAISAKLDNRGV